MMRTFGLLVVAVVLAGCAHAGRSSEQVKRLRAQSDLQATLALSALGRGQPAIARTHADQALALTSTREAFHARALAEAALGDAHAARADFQSALTTPGGRSDSLLLLNYGVFLCSDRQTQQGVAVLRGIAPQGLATRGRVRRAIADCLEWR